MASDLETTLKRFMAAPPAKRENIPGDESGAKGAALHFGGNLVNDRLRILGRGEKHSLGAEEAKEKFLSGLGPINEEKLKPGESEALRLINREAEEGNWDDVEFLKILNKHCVNFALGLPLDYQRDIK